MIQLPMLPPVYQSISQGDGACANNCVAVAIHEDEDDGPKVKRNTLNHNADHYHNYYADNIGLTYKETVGVGEDSKTVTKKTHEEMVNILQSYECFL